MSVLQNLILPKMSDKFLILKNRIVKKTDSDNLTLLLLNINQKKLPRTEENNVPSHDLVIPLLISQYISEVKYPFLNNLRQVRTFVSDLNQLCSITT